MLCPPYVVVYIMCVYYCVCVLLCVCTTMCVCIYKEPQIVMLSTTTNTIYFYLFIVLVQACPFKNMVQRTVGKEPTLSRERIIYIQVYILLFN